MGIAFGYRKHGGPEVQEFFDRPGSEPAPGEVLVRVEVAGVNPLDHMLRSGLVPGLDGGRPFPRALGMEASGTVLAVGADVDGLAVGDPVFGFALTGAGTYAETTLLSAPHTALVPKGVSFTDAATIPVTGTTALDALDQLDLPAGATILVNGVGGGVGLAVAQLARDRGLHVVGTGSTGKRARAEAVGVTFIDYTEADVAATAGALALQGYDGVVDLVGGASLRLVAPLAHVPRAVVAVGDPTVTELGGEPVHRRLDRKNLSCGGALMAAGQLDPGIVAVRPLGDAALALAAVEKGHAPGKIVLDVGGQQTDGRWL